MSKFPLISARVNEFVGQKNANIIFLKVGDNEFEIKSIELQKSVIYDKTDAKM